MTQQEWDEYEYHRRRSLASRRISMILAVVALILAAVALILSLTGGCR